MIKSTLAAALVVCLGVVGPARAQVSIFATNEVRAASVKDRLRVVRTVLKDGGPSARLLSLAISDAFRETRDWAPAAEEYYARKNELAARAAKLDAQIDAVMARNSPERAEETTKALEEICAPADVLRSDYEFYVKLPRLAEGEHRTAAQAAMRLLARTGNYPVALAYYLDKTPRRPPYAPLPAGVMAIRHQ